MDKDDEDKQRPKPKRRPRKRSGGKTRAGAPAGKSARSSASASKSAPAKAAAGKPARAKDSGEKDGASRVRSAADPRLSRSLEYGVAVLEAFSGGRQTLGIADIADIVGVSRSTTHRYAMTLVALGYLEQDSRRKYRLARHAADPGGAAIGTIRREMAARAVLEELREKTGHTVGMGVLNGARVTYVHRLFAHGAGQYVADHDLGVGASIPAYCSALGKVLLASISDAERRELLGRIELKPLAPNTIEERDRLVAELDRISTREVVVSDEELFTGVRSIAVLVPRPRSEHPAAIEVTVPSSVYTVEQMRKRIGPRLKRAAKLISGE
ncbi:MAG TPA: IclR family transcriptional regulator [Solirubrobacteraceae bacterium]|jgi:IclR family pca regulon transcriptional regulator